MINFDALVGLVVDLVGPGWTWLDWWWTHLSRIVRVRIPEFQRTMRRLWMQRVGGQPWLTVATSHYLTLIQNQQVVPGRENWRCSVQRFLFPLLVPSDP